LQQKTSLVLPASELRQIQRPTPTQKPDIGEEKSVVPLLDIENLPKEPTEREVAKELAKLACKRAENTLQKIDPAQRLKQAACTVEISP
jgi:hypothetical protein